MKPLIFSCLIALLFSCNKAKESNNNIIINPETIKKENTSKGKLECEETSFYAGQIKKGKPVEHTFSFTNIGSETVIIQEKTMSCNCTDLITSHDTIPPNKTSTLKVLIDTKDKGTGENEATVTVKTNGLRKFYLLKVNFDIIE